jgi:hypothetical protein
MWFTEPLPPMKYRAAAARVAGSEHGGHRDWRLPSSQELLDLFSAGGSQALRDLQILPGPARTSLWTSELRSRFFGLLKTVAVVQATTGLLCRRSPGDASVQALPIRKA